MKVKIEWLTKFVALLCVLVDEVKLSLAKDGISGTAVDAAHVAMVSAELKRSAFEDYKPPKGKTAKDIAFDLKKLKGVLKLGKPDEICELSVDDDKNKLVVKIGNITRRIGLIDVASLPDPKIPSLNLSASGSLTKTSFLKALKASEAVSDHIAIKAKKGKPSTLSFSAAGDSDDVDIVHTANEDGDLKALKITGDEKTHRSLFSMDYLKSAASVIPSGSIEFRMGNDFPIMLGHDSDGLSCSILIAPRIESD